MTPFEHLAVSLFGADCSERIVIVLSNDFTCHWDESGVDPGTTGKSKSDMPIILVGGYMAHVREWTSFEKQWKSALDEHGIDYFHMVAFANNQYPYRRWPQEKIDSLISSLLAAIKRFPRLRFSCSIEVDDYMEVVKADNIGREDIVRAYHLCARKCIEHVSDLARAAGHAKKILHIFDKGNSAWSSFEATFTQKMLDSLNILNPITQSKIDVIPLQAADILAHQTGRSILIETGRAETPTRYYVERLFNKPGLLIPCKQSELRRWYQEEKLIERDRMVGSYPRRFTVGTTEHSRQILIDLFAEPESHTLTSALMELK